jgi:hypothetical protein
MLHEGFRVLLAGGLRHGDQVFRLRHRSAGWKQKRKTGS